jgi:CheY-like chemotaxis protein
VAIGCDPPGQPCILIVDDDADLVAFLFSVLVESGYSTVAASHGQQALDLLERGLRPHVILIDLMLPQVSGIELLDHIRTDPELKAIPRIVITGAPERRAIVADAVFEKPFDHGELLQAIDRLVPSGGGDANARPASRVTADNRSHMRKQRRSVK